MVTGAAVAVGFVSGGRTGVAAGVLLVAAISAPLAMRLRVNPLDGPGLYALVTAVGFGVTSLAWLGTPPDAGPGLTRSDVSHALLVVAAGLGVFAVAARLAAGRAARPGRVDNGAALTSLPFIGAYLVTLLAAGGGLAFGTFGYLRTPGDAPSASFALGFVASLGPVVILAAAITWLNTRDRTLGRVLGGLLAFHFVFGFVSGVKGTSLLPLLFVALAFVAVQSPLPWRAIGVAGLFVVLILLPANHVYRQAVRGDESAREAVTDPSTYRSDRTLRAAAKYPFARFRYVDHTALIVRDTPEIYAYGDGANYTFLPAFVVVPRVAWDGKPHLNVASQFSHTYWQIPPSIATSQPLTQVGDLYRNFWWPGVVLGLVAWGAIVGAWTRWWSTQRSPRFDAIYIWSLPAMIMYVESDLPLLIATAAKTLPLVWFCAWLLLPGRRGEPGLRKLTAVGGRLLDRARGRSGAGVPRLLAAAGLILATGLLASCGGDDRSARITRTGSSETSSLRGGRLERAPVPLTVADLEGARNGSPEETVIRLWFYAQWGHAAAIPSLYAESVRRVRADADIARAYLGNRSYLAQTRPHITEIDEHGNGNGRRVVRMEILSATDAPRRESFVLVRRNDGYRIAEDTFLAAVAGPGAAR